jgi:THAP4-like, heme-binding beta-barrel domain
MDKALSVLDALEGDWIGGGTVQTPTLPPIDFTEEISFWRRSETSLNYYQRSVRADGQLSHSEVGIWRIGVPGHLELTIALAGSTEVAEGEVIDGSIETTSMAVGRASTSTKFQGARRRYHVAGDELMYEIDLASTNFPMSFHLRAILRRVRHRVSDAAQPPTSVFDIGGATSRSPSG